MIRDGVLRYGMGEGQPLKAVGPNRFVSPSPGVELFFPDTAGSAVREMHILREGAEPEICRLLPPSDSQKIVDFEGRFYSNELDATWALAVRDGRHTARVLNDPPMAFSPLKTDWFLGDNGMVLRFERESETVKRVFVQAGRVTNLMFERR